MDSGYCPLQLVSQPNTRGTHNVEATETVVFVPYPGDVGNVQIPCYIFVLRCIVSQISNFKEKSLSDFFTTANIDMLKQDCT